MIKNLFKIAFRNLLKNKMFSLINITGLALGLSASFVIAMIVYYDLTFDKFHAEGERIHRVTSVFKTPDGEFYNRGVSVPLGEALTGKAGVETVSTFFAASFNSVKTTQGNRKHKNPEKIIFADSDYFKLFNYRWLAGNPTKVLSDPNEVVLTLSRAAKYFPDMPVDQLMEKTLVYNDSVVVRVTGIVADFEGRTDLDFQEFLSLGTAKATDMSNMVHTDGWDNTNSATQVFLKLAEGSSSEGLEKELKAIAEEHAEADLVAMGLHRTFSLQPLSDLHFNADLGIFNHTSSTGNRTLLMGLSFVALFLLLLGCINFINLNTAQAARRAKEIGIKKTLGSSRKQLMFQFLGETFLLTLAASLISLLLCPWLLRLFSDFIPSGVDFGLLKSPQLIGGIFLLLVLVTLLSGFYPAMVLSGFKPISVLKDQIYSGGTKSDFRKYLTVFQFVIAQIFIIATIFVGKQLNYMMDRDMGFKTDALVHIRTPWQDASFEKRLVFRGKVGAINQVSDVGFGGAPPASNSTHSSMVTYRDGDKEIHTEVELLYGDETYLKLYGIPLLAGRDRLNDTVREYVINDTYAKILGFSDPREAIGKYVKIDSLPIPIVGVMKDFNQRSLRARIKPMALIGDWYRMENPQFNTLHFSLIGQPSNTWTEAIKQLEAEWKSVYPESDFELNFMDDSIKRFYEQERRTSSLLQWATGLAIAISCLGLLGLVIYSTERRTKEIGIRKVLGASFAQLNLLLCKEFLLLVGVAFLIAAPLTFLGIRHWLEGFAYRTAVSWWVFPLSGMLMALIALGIMIIRTMASARANPVKSLRTE
ncbi:MAG: FtsX-like permease family protein [Sediminicola sp.]